MLRGHGRGRSASVRSFASSAGSRRSALSGASSRSAVSKTSRSSRQGRRKWRGQLSNQVLTAVDALEKNNKTSISLIATAADPSEVLVDERRKSQTYGCTFCPSSFANRYDWKRHENAVHVPGIGTTWVCNKIPTALPLVCPYDGTKAPTADHMMLHNHDRCIKRPESDRTYFRLDALKQHLKGMHNISDLGLMSDTIKEWMAEGEPLPANDSALHCGFCGIWLPTWEQRVDHVTMHFHCGLAMTDWWPERVNQIPQSIVESIEGVSDHFGNVASLTNHF